MKIFFFYIISVVTLLVIFFGILILIPNVEPRRNETINCKTLNPVLGGGFKPNCSSRWEKRSENRILFNVSFSTDAYGRRNTPEGVLDNRKNLALFFGCSYTLGAGVNDNETVPYYFSKKVQTYNVYNYGGSGFGPQQMLAALSEFDIVNHVRASTGHNVAIYQFLDFHIQRSVGKLHVYNSFGKYFPYYDLDNSEQLVRKGNFKSGRPFLSGLYDLFYKLPILEKTLERLVDTPTENDIYITALIIEESYKKFEKKFKSKDFFVLFYPGSKSSMDSRLIPYLERAGIRYFNYSNLVDMSLPDARVGDGHPSAQTHKKIAERLSKDLRPLFQF